MEIPDKIFFKIGEVARLLEVEPYVIRYWEREFHLSPRRSRSGQRLYRRDEVERLALIKRLVHAEGYTIAGARKIVSRKGRAVQAGEAPGRDAEAHSAEPDSAGADDAWREAVRGEVEALRRLIDEARRIEP